MAVQLTQFRFRFQNANIKENDIIILVHKVFDFLRTKFLLM